MLTAAYFFTRGKRRGKKDDALNTAAKKASQEVVADIKSTINEKDKAKDNNNIASSKETTAKKETVVGNDVFYSTKSETTPAEGDEGYNEFLSLLKGELEDTIITAVSKDEGDEMEEDGVPNYLPNGLSSANTTEEAEGSASTIEDLSPMVASRDSESSFIGDVDLNENNDSESANLLPPLPDIQVVEEKGLVDEKKDHEGGLAQKMDNKEKLEDGLKAETTTKEIIHGEEGEWVVVDEAASIPSGEDTGESSDQAPLRETVVNDSEKVVDKKKEDTWGKLAKKIAARACCLKSVRSNTNAI